MENTTPEQDTTVAPLADGVAEKVAEITVEEAQAGVTPEALAEGAKLSDEEKAAAADSAVEIK